MRIARLVFALVLLAAAPLPASAAPLTVFAAASLGTVLPQIGKLYTAKTKEKVIFSFAGSSVIAKQIDASGGADIFISADEAWMDYLQQRGRIQTRTRINLLGNHLVLIAPKTSRVTIKIVPHFPLVAALHGGRLAVADTDTVPAGRYAREALTNLDMWNSVSGHLAQAENVRIALAYVARGEAPLGIVYQTDAAIEPAVKIVAIFPDASHKAITYPAAVLSGAKPDAKKFLGFLKTKPARDLFEKAGFIVLP